ncbi:MAG TPA: DUF4190 domain-containing protein [Thermoanaerobaculia bacterium]|jgi:uncharacterized membrane protein YjgN (DUF898 family)|nr:DUF4190 domain-containing protein [Thermoanaerobaculia bacterium]
MSVANPPQPQPQSSSTQAVTALVLGILGVVCCGLLAPIAWYLGSQEQKAIREGRSPAAGEGLAKAAVILGVIGTVLLVLSVVWIFFWGGMAILQGMANR